MKKLIFSLVFTFTLPLSQVALSQDAPTTNLSDAEILELEGNVCNNTVDGILSSNEAYETALDDTLVTNSNGDYNVLAKSSNDDDSSNLLTTSAITDVNYSSESDKWELDDDNVTPIVVVASTVDTSIVADPADPSAQDELTNVCP